MDSLDVFLRKYGRRLAVVAGAVIIIWIIYALRMLFLPFGISLILAYMLLPLVTWIEERFPPNWRCLSCNRIYAITVIYFIIVLVFGAFSFFTVNSIITAIHYLSMDSVQYFTSASDTLKQWTDPIRQNVPEELREELDIFIQEAGDTMLESIHQNIMNGIAEIPHSLGVVVGLTSVPFFLFYLVKDQQKLRGVYYNIPNWAKPYAENVSFIVAKSFQKYIFAMIVQGLVVGVLTFIGLLIVRAPMAPLLSVLSGVTEMIPMVGPWIGGVAAIIVTLALAPDKIIWVALVIAAVQLLENLFLMPRIQSAVFKIHPIVTLLLLMGGGYVAGVWGIILIMPLTAIAVGVYKYCCEVSMGKIAPKEEKSALPE